MTREAESRADAGAYCRVTVDLTGVVQGIGFRPALYRLAVAAGLGGRVQNRSGAVRLTLEGPSGRIREFLAALAVSPPPHARIDAAVETASEWLSGPPSTEFVIEESAADARADVVIPADLALCADCWREIFDPADRRYGYAFTTCTRCGPRYTVVHGMPYDRNRTTMSVFPLCAACRHEYGDPGDRRYHAESIACPACGPRLALLDAAGRTLPGDPLRAARAALAAGAIVAVRGLGGFLLAADARNPAALDALRRRKSRPHKPFAVMARSAEIVTTACECDAAGLALLASPAAPIAILDARPGADGLPLDRLSPDTRTLGVMLPTTPLHALLATPLDDDPTPAFDWLVMTSGNRGGEPICLTAAEARARLAGIADLLLVHDREINLRCDDSLCVLRDGRPQVWRRARGFAPAPVRLPFRLRRRVLAMGAELKNAIALGYDTSVLLSPHVGDLETPEALDGLRQVAEALPRFADREPEVVAVDLHPDFHSTRLGREIASRRGLPVVAVQHHHAHALACLGEHGRREGLALVFDGTGFGPDGNVWGAELLDVNGAGGFRRVAAFAPVPLPGGDAAVRHPARQLAGRFPADGADLPASWRARLGIADEAWQVWCHQATTGVNAPATHAAGRLFDAFAALLGLAPDVTTYEGQTAIRLEAAARRATDVAGGRELPFGVETRDGLLWIDWSPAFRRLLETGESCLADAPAWAVAAHAAIARAAAVMIEHGMETSGQRTVALSGGVFMNRLLHERLVADLGAVGIECLVHRETPPNDGCIACGQVLAAGA
jgi:hydrogenase maturation protein HypF